MSMREVGRCRHDPCGQTDLLWEDGYCTEDCREQATGCLVPFCGCAGGCGIPAPAARLPEPGGLV